MVKTNKTYDAPDMKVYQVHTEGVMCESKPRSGATFSAQSRWGDDPDDDTMGWE